jgi:hypothetical protein
LTVSIKIGDKKMANDLTHHSARAAACRGQGEPAAATVASTAQELSVEARVEALDGSERKLLLNQLAHGYPDLVEAGFDLVAEWRAECAEKRRASLRRREHDRRRRRDLGLGVASTVRTP